MKKINAVIMAAGLSSRFAPLSYELPKALLKVHNEILIERQIRQLREAGIDEIIIVVGYKKELFSYLKEKFKVILIENTQYIERNNHESLYVARAYIKNTFICSADNYFQTNVFLGAKDKPYYASVYVAGKSKEWCLHSDAQGRICDVQIGGEDAWIMLGHVLFDETFSNRFFKILDEIYDQEDTKNKLWEAIYRDHIQVLDLYIRKYEAKDIFEFDSLDELRQFDPTYLNNSNSTSMSYVSTALACTEEALHNFKPLYEDGVVVGCSFQLHEDTYHYYYKTSILQKH